MLDQIILSVTLVLGVFLAEFLCLKAFGRQDSGLAGLIELLLVIGSVSFFSQVVMVHDSFVLMVMVVFLSGFFPALIVKACLQFYSRRKHPEQFISRKSTVIQLIRAMRAEGLSKKRIGRVFRRVKISVDKYLKLF